MNKIDEMLKNEKVEWKRLDEVCEFQRGQAITKKNIIEGKIPVIAGGQKPAYYHGISNRNGPTIAVAGSGAYAGFVSYWEQPIFLSDAFSIEPNEVLNKRYLYHWLLSVQYKIFELKQGSGIPHVYSKDLGRFKIPIPSIETQEKIVKILDKFTNYVTELQAELQLRTKHYEYYRDMLLSEDCLNKLSTKLDINIDGEYLLKETTLGEIGKFTRGNGLKKSDFISKGSPVIHYGEIYTKYGFETNKTYSFASEEIYNKLRKAKKNDLLIATTSENIEDIGKCVVWVGSEEIGFSGDMYSYSTNENSKYIAYFFQTASFYKQKEKYVSGTKVIRLHSDNLERFKIIIPPLEIQNKVVEVLDKFQALTEDTKGLLPQEIEERKKQYEYFREKLLTFNAEYDSKQASKQASKVISNSYLVLLKEAADIVGVRLLGVEWKNLGEIGNFENGKGMPKSLFVEDGEVGAIHYGHIYTNYNLYVETPIVRVHQSEVKNLRTVTKGELIIAKTSENIADIMKSIVYLGDKPAVFGGHAAKFIHRENGKYLSYVFNGYRYLIKEKNRLAKGVKIMELSISDMEKIKIPIPSMSVQNYIVDILDSFDTVVNSISTGLPKEIELRQKQYEYYREKLLDFKKEN